MSNLKNLIILQNMKKSLIIFSLLIFTSLFLSNCAKNKTVTMEKNEYEELKKSKNDSDLYEFIYMYELEHPDHFASKLDLAKLNLFAGNYSEAWKYLTRAEGIAKTSEKKLSNQELSSMYGTFASLYVVSNDYNQAKTYIDKAYDVPKFGEQFGFLKGRIEAELGNNEDALKVFDKTYSKYSAQISPDELRTYLYLTANFANYKKALTLLEKYFKTGAFFPGLGLLASGIYEKNNDYTKSVLSAFLDYEYNSCYGNKNDKKFSENLKTAIKKAQEENNPDAQKALQAILSLYSKDVELPIIDTDFFAYKYIYYKYKYLNFNLEPNDATYYLSIENNMKTFPIYYWILWDSASKNGITNYTNWIPVLEKIILLSSSDYTEKARIALGKIKGLSENESKKLLLPVEVQNYVNSFISTGDEKILGPIYEFISVKDCDYVFTALSILKRYSKTYPLLRKQLTDNASSIKSSRLTERLEFIIN